MVKAIVIAVVLGLGNIAHSYNPEDLWQVCVDACQTDSECELCDWLFGEVDDELL